MSNNGRLVITDGTAANTVSMLVGLPGTMLQDWYPKSPQPLSGVWASSPYQDGKHLINKTYNNIGDIFTVSISAETMDADIHNLRRFIVLLEKAILYWTDEFSTAKYWLEVRGECETNIRYAFVIDYNIPEITDPFFKPFASNTESVLDSIQILIEHTIWTDELGVGDSCVEISSGVEVGTLTDDEFTPTQSGDDAYTWDTGNTISIASSNLAIGRFVNNYATGIRFRNINIPANAIIANAHITFHAENGDVTDDVNIAIRIENNAAPALFSTYANFHSRSRSVETVPWLAIAHWVGGNSYSTPSITTLIQAAVDKPGWASGGNIVVFLEDDGSDTPAFRQPSSWNSGDIPSLYIEWYDAPYMLHGELDSCLRGAAAQPLWRSRLLTHAFVDHAGAFGANLVVPGNPAYELFPPAADLDNGDNLYCGIEDLGDPDLASPFNSLVINLGVQGSLLTVVPEYCDAPGSWAALSYMEEPDNWWLDDATLGVHLMLWNYPDDWDQCNINGVDGFWIRFRITAHAGHTPPKGTANTIPYTISWPHIQIAGSELQGDIEAQINFLLAKMTIGRCDRIMISAKKYTRTNGGKFVPMLACNTHNVLPDATYTPNVAAASEVVALTAYTGWALEWFPAAIVDELLCTFELGAASYTGRYRVFIRILTWDIVAIGDIGFYLKITNLVGSTYSTPIAYSSSPSNGWSSSETIDLGLIAFPAEILEVTAGAYKLTVELWATNKVAANSAYIYDMVLMPVDEAHLEIEIEPLLIADTVLDFDYTWKIVTTNYKLGSYGFVLVNSPPMTVDWDDEIYNQLKVNILGSFELEAEEIYWIIFLPYRLPGGPIGWVEFAHLIAPSLDKNQRYLLARGDE